MANQYVERARELKLAANYLAGEPGVWEAAEKVFGGDLTVTELIAAAHNSAMIRALENTMIDPWLAQLTISRDLTTFLPAPDGRILAYIPCLHIYLTATPAAMFELCGATAAAYKGVPGGAASICQLVRADVGYAKMAFTVHAEHHACVMELAEKHFDRDATVADEFTIAAGRAQTRVSLIQIDKYVPASTFMDVYVRLREYVAETNNNLSYAICPILSVSHEGLRWYSWRLPLTCKNVDKLAAALMVNPADDLIGRHDTNIYGIACNDTDVHMAALIAELKTPQ